MVVTCSHCFLTWCYMKLPLLGALLLVLHAYFRQPTCSLINWTGCGAITHYLAWALSPQIRIRSSEQTHSTRGILPRGNPGLPYATFLYRSCRAGTPAVFVHCTFCVPCLCFTPQTRRWKPSDFSVDTYFGEPPVLVTCLFDVTAVASTLKADTTDRV